MCNSPVEAGPAAAGAAPPQNAGGGTPREPPEDAAAFQAELLEHWRRHGKSALDTALRKDPVRYLALAAKFAPAGGRDDGTDLIALLAALDRE